MCSTLISKKGKANNYFYIHINRCSQIEDLLSNMKSAWLNVLGKTRLAKYKHMKNLKWIILIIQFLAVPISGKSQRLDIRKLQETYQVSIDSESGASLVMPSEGLWSIATAWKDNWPANWNHAKPQELMEYGGWKILTGTMKLPEGEWHLRDAYRQENGRIKCVRRFEWKGSPLEKVTLSVRWKVNANSVKAFLPGILYYGNPSGEKNGAQKVPVFHGKPKEAAIFEEHRYPMPFACLEWNDKENYYGAALHTLPSPVQGGNRNDQWWSLGIQTNNDDSELVMLSGPVTYNGQKSVVKALQQTSLPYGETYMNVKSGMVIEKTFYLEVFKAKAKGTAFQRPVHTSIDLFKPFYAGDFPSFDEIIKMKYKFAKSRWIEGANYAGFNMYPEFERQRIVLGWAGQSEAPGYALQVLAEGLGDEGIWEMVQKSMDHICTSPVGKNGFPVRYEVEKDQWEKPDPVSEGQAMNSIAQAIRAGRKNKKVDVAKWEVFLQKTCEIHAKRLLSEDWIPRNTAEAFYISPLLISSDLFQNDLYKKAALKVANYFAARHLDMDEPYWGGTLDATCEDKEGAWGAFQGFMASYEYTKEQQYLDWAQHAGDVVLSYSVVWDIPLPPGRMADHNFKTRGWTSVSPQNQHLDIYGVLIAPAFYKLAQLTNNEDLKRFSKVMYRSCGQMIDHFGSQGEQLLQTNFIQHIPGDKIDVRDLRGGYSENWTVFWITAHFLNAAATFKEMGVKF